MYRKHNELLYQQYTDTKPTPTFKTKDAIWQFQTPDFII
jgi:hypothetical protein